MFVSIFVLFSHKGLKPGQLNETKYNFLIDSFLIIHIREGIADTNIQVVYIKWHIIYEHHLI